MACLNHPLCEYVRLTVCAFDVPTTHGSGLENVSQPLSEVELEAMRVVWRRIDATDRFARERKGGMPAPALDLVDMITGAFERAPVQVRQARRQQLLSEFGGILPHVAR
jgi:hypothetical protein